MLVEREQETDEDLLLASNSGSEAAFVALYRKWQGPIYRFALRMSGSEGIAEDVTQEVFMAVVGGASGYDPGKGPLAAYLFGVARNQVLRRITRDRSVVSLDDEDGEVSIDEFAARPDPLLDLTREETVQRVRDAIGVLPLHYREVVLLCEIQELSYLDAAAALGCAVGTVRSRLHRAKQMLLDRLSVSEQRAAAPALRAERY